jgi:alpha-beta hydrolase superfamily lysophospholipase
LVFVIVIQPGLPNQPDGTIVDWNYTEISIIFSGEEFVQETNFNMKSSYGLDLYCRDWHPDDQSPKAVISLIHGLGDHSGRFAHVAEHFVNRQMAVTTFDLPGHGKSEGKRGHFESYDAVMLDIQSLLQYTSEKYPGMPIFLYGHSLGGALVLYFGYTQNSPLKGLVVTSPGLSPAAPVPSIKMVLGKILSRMMPSFAMDNGLDISGISHDPLVVERYRKDPLVHPYISARLGMDLIANGEWLLAHNSASPFPYPLLLMQGDQDRLVDPQKNIAFGQHLTGNVTFKIWQGMYHELHNEPAQLEMFNFIDNWIEQRLDS